MGPGEIENVNTKSPQPQDNEPICLLFLPFCPRLEAALQAARTAVTKQNRTGNMARRVDGDQQRRS